MSTSQGPPSEPVSSSFNSDNLPTGYDIPLDEFAVYGTVTVDPAHADEVEAIYTQTTRRAMTTDEEPGTLYYCICRDTTDRSLFHFFERYAGREAFARHNDQGIIRELVGSGWMWDVTAVFAKPMVPHQS